MSATYRVIMRGIRPGQTPDRVAHRLAELFKMDVEQVTGMLSERAMTIKRGVDLRTAAKYQASLEKRGCACLIEPEHKAQQAPTVVTVANAGAVERHKLKRMRAVSAGIGLVALSLLAFVLARISGF